MMKKEELRTQMRRLRRELSVQEQRSASESVCESLHAFEPYVKAKCVMAYIACRGELSLEPAIREILESGKMLVLPRCEASGKMTARRVSDLSQLVSGTYGLMEPDEKCEIAVPQEIDLILVPGTAFDRKGNRLGQGGGYYDRFLPKTRAICVGVCHAQALLDDVPCGTHDIPMDAVITPEEIIRLHECRRNSNEQSDRK